jgi:hypothetical protein
LHFIIGRGGKMKNNNCCFVNRNRITIKNGWSYLCKKCGRYTYDYDGNQTSVKFAKEHLRIRWYKLMKRSIPKHVIKFDLLLKKNMKEINKRNKLIRQIVMEGLVK